MFWDGCHGTNELTNQVTLNRNSNLKQELKISTFQLNRSVHLLSSKPLYQISSWYVIYNLMLVCSIWQPPLNYSTNLFFFFFFFVFFIALYTLKDCTLGLHCLPCCLFRSTHRLERISTCSSRGGGGGWNNRKQSKQTNQTTPC